MSVIQPVGYEGMAGTRAQCSSDLFSQLDISARGPLLADVGHGFIVHLLLSLPLTSSTSRFLSILCASKGQTAASRFRHTLSQCSGVPHPRHTVSVWSYQNCPFEPLGFAVHKCLELSGIGFQKS